MMQADRMAGRLLRRPSATAMDSGKARKMDTVASSTVRGRPPQRSVRTCVRPSTPPPMRTKKTTMMATHIAASQGFQNTRMQLAIRPATMRLVASTGRQCSSNG